MSEQPHVGYLCTVTLILAGGEQYFAALERKKEREQDGSLMSVHSRSMAELTSNTHTNTR